MRNDLRIFVLIAATGLAPIALHAANCAVVQHPAPTNADKALLAADYAKAATLYQAALSAHPGDSALTAGLV